MYCNMQSTECIKLTDYLDIKDDKDHFDPVGIDNATGPTIDDLEKFVLFLQIWSDFLENFSEEWRYDDGHLLQKNIYQIPMFPIIEISEMYITFS